MRHRLPIALGMLLIALRATPAAAVLTFVEAWVDEQGGVEGLAMAQDVVVSPDGKHVYAVSEGDSALVRFDRDPTSGELTFVQALVNGADGVTGIASGYAVALSPDGAHLYVASGADAGAVAVFARDAMTGALTFVEAEVNGENGVSGLTVGEDVVVAPDGAHVYALGFTPGAVLTFARNPTTGALTFVEKDEEGVNGLDGIAFATELVISPDGAHVYVTGDADDSVAVFARNPTTGALAFVEAERDGVGGVDGIDAPFAIAISDDGAHVYAGGADDDGLAVFSRDAGTGELTFVEAFHEGAGGVDGINAPMDVAVTPDGTHVLVAAAAESEVGVFARNPVTGALTFVEAIGGASLGGINSLRLAPGGLHLYTTARSSDSVALFAVATAPTTTTTTSTTTTSTTSGGTTTLPTTSTTTTPAPSSSTTTVASTSTTTPTTSPTTSTVTSSSTSTSPETTLASTTSTAAPSTSTTTLPGGGCASEAGLEAVACRLGVLRDATAAATALGELRPKLDRPLEKAIERVADARSRCQAGRTAGTRRRLKQAKKALGRYVRRLRGERARTTAPADVREPLAVEGDGIAGAVRTLRRAIACPADA